jgi:hypothetical protein
LILIKAFASLRNQGVFCTEFDHMPTLSHPSSKDRSRALQCAVDAHPAVGTKQSFAHPALRTIEGKEFTIARSEA